MNFPSTYLKLHCKRSFIFVKADKNFNLFLKCVCPILLTRCEICSYVPDKFYPFKNFFFSKFHNCVAVVIVSSNGNILEILSRFFEKEKKPRQVGAPLPTDNRSIASERIFEQFMSVVNFFNYSAHHYLSKI